MNWASFGNDLYHIVAEAGEGHGWAGATNNLAEDTYLILVSRVEYCVE
jgi:hypothetical protein